MKEPLLFVSATVAAAAIMALWAAFYVVPHDRMMKDTEACTLSRTPGFSTMRDATPHERREYQRAWKECWEGIGRDQDYEWSYRPHPLKQGDTLATPAR